MWGWGAGGGGVKPHPTSGRVRWGETVGQKPHPTRIGVVRRVALMLWDGNGADVRLR